MSEAVMTEREINDLWATIANVARAAMVIPAERVRQLQEANARGPKPVLWDGGADRNATELLSAFAKFRAALEPLHDSEMRRVGADGVAWAVGEMVR